MAKHPEGQSCGTCRYMGELNSYGFGNCRRHPPTVADGRGVFPRTCVSEWCGEWALANPQTVSEGAATLARLVLLGDLTAARALADKLKEGE